ncbi:MAG: helix-turn-helix transcriptional regulator [Christensenellaceae bacterium]
MAVMNKIRALRKLKRISQDQLANASGVRQKTVSDWVKQQYQPAVENIIGLMKAFNCNFEDLFEELDLSYL